MEGRATCVPDKNSSPSRPSDEPQLRHQRQENVTITTVPAVMDVKQNDQRCQQSATSSPLENSPCRQMPHDQSISLHSQRLQLPVDDVSVAVTSIIPAFASPSSSSSHSSGWHRPSTGIDVLESLISGGDPSVPFPPTHSTLHAHTPPSLMASTSTHASVFSSHKSTSTPSSSSFGTPIEAYLPDIQRQEKESHLHPTTNPSCQLINDLQSTSGYVPLHAGVTTSLPSTYAPPPTLNVTLSPLVSGNERGMSAEEEAGGAALAPLPYLKSDGVAYSVEQTWRGADQGTCAHEENVGAKRSSEKLPHRSSSSVMSSTASHTMGTGFQLGGEPTDPSAERIERSVDRYPEMELQSRDSAFAVSTNLQPSSQSETDCVTTALVSIAADAPNTSTFVFQSPIATLRHTRDFDETSERSRTSESHSGTRTVTSSMTSSTQDPSSSLKSASQEVQMYPHSSFNVHSSPPFGTAPQCASVPIPGSTFLSSILMEDAEEQSRDADIL